MASPPKARHHPSTAARRVSPQRQPGNHRHRKRNSLDATGEIAVVAIGQATNHLGLERLDTGGLRGASGGERLKIDPEVLEPRRERPAGASGGRGARLAHQDATASV